MVQIARALRIQRLNLTANVLTAVFPPIATGEVMVSNGTAGDLQVHTTDDGTEYRAIAPGFERPFTATIARSYRHDEVAFWLKAIAGGLVILDWK